MTPAKKEKGLLVISLDFELMWGVWDVTSIQQYGPNITGVKKVIPQLLDIFNFYNVKATFATVGFLFTQNKEELLNACPPIKPAYSNPEYNVYLKELSKTGNNELDDAYHFGSSLFEQIKKSPHEIGSHSFSHYYCLEEGQTDEQFNADIEAAVKIAVVKNMQVTSFVFPRNQVNKDYLAVLKNNGFTAYRGNPDSWIYKPRKFLAEILLIRLLRLLDTYLPISGYNTHRIHKYADLPVNIPASRFLKPYSPALKWFENIRLHRIKKEMFKAAERKEIYHLWWHPHNFGINIEKNFSFLREILEHYKMLEKKFGFKSVTMHEAADLISKKNDN
jgi:peptidoglycan/xylan/chitin deacetylase (PgdA/CDA1 family)